MTTICQDGIHKKFALAADFVVEDEEHVQARRLWHRRIPLEDGEHRPHTRLHHGALLHGQEGHLVLAKSGPWFNVAYPLK